MQRFLQPITEQYCDGITVNRSFGRDLQASAAEGWNVERQRGARLFYISCKLKGVR
jgi:hypothetical protein